MLICQVNLIVGCHEKSSKRAEGLSFTHRFTLGLFREVAQTACREALLPGLAGLQHLSLRTKTEEQKSQKTAALRRTCFFPFLKGPPLQMTGSDHGVRRGTLWHALKMLGRNLAVIIYALFL